MPKFGRKVPHLRCDSHTSFKVKRSSGPVMLTQIVRHIFRMAKPIRTSNLVYQWRTTTRISHRRHDLQGQRSRSQGHVISLSWVRPMAHKSKMNSRSITKMGRRVPRDTFYIAHQFQAHNVKSQGHRPTNAYTQSVPYLSNGKAYELQSWCADGGRGKRHDLQDKRPSSQSHTVYLTHDCKICTRYSDKVRRCV